MSNNDNKGITKKRLAAYLSSAAAVAVILCEIINSLVLP